MHLLKKCVRTLPFIAACLAITLRCATTTAGTLWTNDGKTYDGQTSFQSGQVAVATADGRTIAVDLANILYASFNTPRPATLAAGYLGPLSAHAIGSAASAESVLTRGIYAIQGNGTQIAGTSDNFHLLSQGIFGDAEISVRLCDVRPAAAAAGIMLRDSDKPDARHISLLVDAAGNLSLRSRAETGREATQINLGPITLPAFLRLTRIDYQIRAYTSPDGAAWTQVGGIVDDAAESPHPINASLPAGLLTGLAFYSGDAKQTGIATFDQLTLQENGAQSPPPPAHAAKFHHSPHEAFLKGVLLRDGTFLADATLSGDPTAGLKISWIRKDYPTDLAHLARVQKESIAPATFGRIPLATSGGRPLSGGTGALFLSGDYLQGDIIAYEKDRLEINSILFGLSSAKTNDITAIAFHGTEAPPPGFRLQLLDGSILIARKLAISSTKDLLIDADTLGALSFPVTQLISLQRTTGTISLNDLPFIIDAPPNTEAEALTCFGRASSFWLATDSTLLDRGIIAPAGATLTCHPPAGTRLLQTRIAVPEWLPQQTRLQFTIIADGKEIYRSPTLTSHRPSLIIAVALENPSTLSLCVAVEAPTTAPAFGLWGIPLLMR